MTFTPRVLALRITRTLLVALTVLGLLLPGVSAAIALATPGTQTVIICTGDGLRTITIDASGKSTIASHQDSHCLLINVTDTAERVFAHPPLAAPVGSVRRSMASMVLIPSYEAARPPPRAPPVA